MIIAQILQFDISKKNLLILTYSSEKPFGTDELTLLEKRFKDWINNDDQPVLIFVLRDDEGIRIEKGDIDE